ncbi:MAG: amino acid permease [Simkaniaceae bacterium]|jgi:putative glutamate/gamma-aminobutyrate antiporter|nr:MAG: amino acid permease [Simkaniaceae bacterium]
MKKKHLSVFLLAMMNVAVIMSLRGLPLMAEEGLSLLFYLAFSAIVFLIPTSLVSAELATGWPEGGGVYRWVKEAFGDHAGFTAIWLQWIQNVIWYPTILAFAAGALSYLFLDPTLAASKLFNVAVILIVYWGATLINFRGVVASGLLSSLGVICGTIFPGILIIALGVTWFIMGKPLAFITTSETFFPSFSDFKSISFLAGVVLLFAGMEVSAVHANEVKDPKKDYPKAIFLAVLIILVIFTFGSLAIAAVLPPDKISLTAGLMQGFKELLDLFSMTWLLPVMGLLIAFGAIGGVAAWIVGPSKGLFATAKAGDIPPLLETKNKNNVPTHILIIQGIIVTILSLVFLLMPTVSTAFFLLTALTAILYLIMYMMLYAAAIRLRYSQPDVKRAYKVPGGNFGMWLVSGLGILGAAFAITVGFFPPKQLTIGNPLFYVLFLIGGIIVFVGAPILIIHFRKPSWKLKDVNKEK